MENPTEKDRTSFKVILVVLSILGWFSGQEKHQASYLGYTLGISPHRHPHRVDQGRISPHLL